jgi:PAS domain S-box-containing protein
MLPIITGREKPYETAETGNGEGAITIAGDITGRKRAEEELMKHREHLEELVKEHTTELRIATEQLQKEMTARKRAEQAVREAREYAESIIETVREPLVVLDTNLRVISVNHSFYETFKVIPEETEGKLIYDLGNRQWNISKLRVLLEEILPRDNQFQNFEVDHVFPIIGRKIMLLNARQIYSKGIGAQMILVAIEDITERKKAEDEIKKLNEDLKHRVKELEAAYQKLETFSYSVSHDLRAPLLGINGLSRVLLEGYSNHFDAKGQQFLSTIHSGTQKMLQLIDDLLTFSRSEHQQMELSDIDMGELAKGVFGELKSIIPEQTLLLDIKALPPARGDQSMIRQVFTNLLSNAIKFTRPKGAGVIEIGCIVKGNQNIYYVKDNGVGFDMQYASKLFGAFQRHHTIDEFEGTGVGLAIVERIIQRHGGQVWAEGKVNEGATFYFTLPIGEDI